MKTRLKTIKLLLVSCTAFATTAVFGQTVYTWTGSANGTNMSTAGNWTTNGVDPATNLPNGNNGLGDGFQDIAQWDGKTTTNLLLFYNTTWPNTGFGSVGVNLVMTASQTKDVQITTAQATSAGMGVNHVTNNSPNAAFIMGDTNSNNWLVFGRPAGAIHYYVNNSTAPSIINPSIKFQAGGGTGYTYEFGGTGDWIVNNFLMPDNNAGACTVTLDGPGNVYWYGGRTGSYNPNSGLSTININGGTLFIKNAGLFTGNANQPIANNTTLVFDAPSQSQNLNGIISGSGVMVVTNGNLRLGGQSTFFGGVLLKGGTLTVNGAETEGLSGPLGILGTVSFTGGTLQFSANNTYDYSGRFETAANQAYSIDTGGQNVTFTNSAGLSSSGGTLTKIGSGTLTLGGPSTYSGATTISAGKLVFQGTKAGSGSITVSDGAALGVYATGTQVAPGTLTLGTSSGVTLEFDNINSTTTAPLAAGTVSATSTVTINLNSGTFTVGQNYPLLSWTSGSAPAVTLGTLNGFSGNLSTNGNTIRLNITGTAFRWTGANNGTWDTTTANNWIQNGAPAVFANGAPVLFDNSSSALSVTINSPVQPTAVTVNSTNAYTITSSGGNNIGGSASLTKSSSGMLTLSGGANSYSGVTTISGGILSVAALANGGSASDIGAASSGAGNLLLNGGTLQYIGSGASVDRLFTLGTGGGTIDASGFGALNLNNSGAVGLSGVGPRGLILAGTDANNNTLAASLADNGGLTTLTKNGTGTWVLTGANAHSGGTTISAGTLQVGAGGASGSLGSGSVVNGGTLVFNRTGSLTVDGAVTGTGSVTKDGSGTVILAGNNTYSGGTTITAGTLQIGNGGATGSLGANGAIANQGTLVFNSTAQPPDIFGVISGIGSLIKRGSGTVRLFGANTFTGNTTIEAGTLQICTGNQGAFASPQIAVSNNATLMMVRQDNNVFTNAGNIVGAGRVWKDINNINAGDVTLTGTNTYTGGTFIAGGGIILGDGINPGAGSIVGNVTFAASTIDNNVARTLTFNRPDDFVFPGNIIAGPTNAAAGTRGSVVQNGFGVLTLTGTNTYTAGTTINSGTLQVGNGGTSGSIGTGNVNNNGTLIFNRSDAMTFAGVISGAGSVVKSGAGTLTLSASNTYAGFTVVSNGTLFVNGADSSLATTVNGGTLGGTGAFFAAITLDPGTTLMPGATNNAVGTLTVNSDLSIGGNLAIDVNKSLSPSNDVVMVTGALSKVGAGTLTVANLGPNLAVGDKFTLFSQPLQNGAALTVTGGGATWNNNLAVDGSITVATVLVVTPPTLGYSKTGNNLQFTWTGGFKLQTQTNAIGVGLSTNWVDYPGGGTSPVTVPIVGTNASVFYRLAPTP